MLRSPVFLVSGNFELQVYHPPMRSQADHPLTMFIESEQQ
jgi:hypothetical protein